MSKYQSFTLISNHSLNQFILHLLNHGIPLAVYYLMTNPLVQKIILLMTLLAGLLIQYKDLHAKNKFPQQPHLNQVSTKDFTKQQIFPPNSNLFILSKFQIKEDLFLIKVEVKNRNTSSKKYWLQVDMNNLPGKLLTNDLRDLLAFPTHNLYNGFFVIKVGSSFTQICIKIRKRHKKRRSRAG